MTANILTQDKLKELLTYCPDTGLFIWLVNRHRRKTKGKIAGSTKDNGYIRINIDGRGYLAHRLVFLYIEGSLPPDMVDHINRVKSDNRWDNLRHSNRSLNGRNRIDNAKFIGVFPNNLGNKKWAAQTGSKDGRKTTIGYFHTHLCACYARWSHDLNFKALKNKE